MDYVYDVSSLKDTTDGPDDTEVKTLWESYADCWEALMDLISDEQPIIKDLMLLVGEMQDYCHRSYREYQSNQIYYQS